MDVISCTAEDIARRAARFAAAPTFKQLRKEPRVPHPDASATVTGDVEKKLREVVRARLKAGEDVSPYQLSLLSSYGLTVADLTTLKKKKKRKSVGLGANLNQEAVAGGIIAAKRGRGDETNKEDAAAASGCVLDVKPSLKKRVISPSLAAEKQPPEPLSSLQKRIKRLERLTGGEACQIKEELASLYKDLMGRM